VARVGRELALSAQGRTLTRQRLADGHERPPCVDRAEPEGDDDDDQSADQQDGQHHLQRLLLRGPILDDLDGEGGPLDDDVLGEDAEGRVGDRRRLDILPAVGRRGDAGLVREPGRQLPALPQDRVAVGIEGQRVGARRGPAEDEAQARLVVWVRSLPGLPREAGLQLADPSIGQRAGNGRVEHGRQGEQHEQRRAAAPQGEIAPDVTHQPGVGGQGRRVLRLEIDG
jgi:hypothetical protein